MDKLEALERAYQQAETVVARVTPEMYALPTPCTEWDVRTLLNHLVNAISGFTQMLTGANPDWGADVLGDDPVTALRAAAARNVEGWRAPGALDRPAGLETMHLVDLNLTDTVTHTWDLARATGQRVTFDDELARFTLDLWREAPMDVTRSKGAFGPEVPVPPDARAIDRLVGLLGRHPA